MYRVIWSRLKFTSQAFEKDDIDLYKKVMYDYHNSIRDAKVEFKDKLQAQLIQADARQLWQGLNTIMGNMPKWGVIYGNDAAILDEINAFYMLSKCKHNTTEACTLCWPRPIHLRDRSQICIDEAKLFETGQPRWSSWTGSENVWLKTGHSIHQHLQPFASPSAARNPPSLQIPVTPSQDYSPIAPTLTMLWKIDNSPHLHRSSGQSSPLAHCEQKK